MRGDDSGCDRKGSPDDRADEAGREVSDPDHTAIVP
jgi:hypothetical protein